MTRFRFTIDARLPLRFGPLSTRSATEAVLTDQTPAAPPSATFQPGGPGHAADCICCLPRGEAALALAGLFRDRAVSTAPPFRAVLAVVTPEGEAAIRAALDSDPVVSMRFRLA